MRAERSQDVGSANDTAQAEHADDQEPEQHQGSEDVADKSRSLALNQKQADQDRNAHRYHGGRELGCIELETLDGAKHRDRRCDDPITIEKSSANQADYHQGSAPAAASGMTNIEERQQCDDAALATVVGAHDQDGIFE